MRWTRLLLFRVGLVALAGLAPIFGGCGGDLCDDLLMEEQACDDYSSPVAPAGETCSDERGVYAQCVLDSGLDLCKGLIGNDASVSAALQAKCGAAPQ